MDNIYKAVQLTIDSQNLALSKTPTHVYIANQYVDTNDTPLITAPFIIQKALENGTGVVDIVSSTIGSIYEVRLLCEGEVLISGYFYMPPMNVNFSELELYTSYPPRTPPVINEFWQKTENFILEKTNTLLNFVQVFNAVSSMRLSLGYLEELATTKKSNLVSAINEVYKKYEGVGSLYEKNVAAAGAGAKGWTSDLIADGDQTQKQINLYGAKKYDIPVGGYPVGAIVVLDNGERVQSIVANNTVNPNSSMTGWIKINDSRYIKHSLSDFYKERAVFDKLFETKSIYDFLIIGENYTDANFDWSPVYNRAITSLLADGGGKLYTPNKSTPYLLGGIVRADGKLVGIEIPFVSGSDWGSTSKKVDFVCESQSVVFIPNKDDMVVFRHSSSYCEIGKFQIQHNNKLRCVGFALTPQSWTNPNTTSQQSHNYIHDIYTYGILESFILQSGGNGGCYYNTFVNCYAVGLSTQGCCGLALKAGLRSSGQSTKASPPNRNRFFNFKALGTNIALDLASGDTNYFYGFSSEANTRAGQFAETPTAVRISSVDSEGCAIQGNIFYGLSVESATKDAEILCDRTQIYGHTLQASKTTLSSTFVSGGHGVITGCYDATVFPNINNGVISNFGGILPSGIPTYETGITQALALDIQDFGGKFKGYSLTIDKFENVAAVSNSVSYLTKYNKRVDFECRFSFRPTANNVTVRLALPYNANYNLYANTATHNRAFSIPVCVQSGVNPMIVTYARIVSKDGLTATHIEIAPPASNWNVDTSGQFNDVHIAINYRST